MSTALTAPLMSQVRVADASEQRMVKRSDQSGGSESRLRSDMLNRPGAPHRPLAQPGGHQSCGGDRGGEGDRQTQRGFADGGEWELIPAALCFLLLFLWRPKFQRFCFSTCLFFNITGNIGSIDLLPGYQSNFTFGCYCLAIVFFVLLLFRCDQHCRLLLLSSVLWNSKNKINKRSNMHKGRVSQARFDL